MSQDIKKGGWPSHLLNCMLFCRLPSIVFFEFCSACVLFSKWEGPGWLGSIELFVKFWATRTFVTFWVERST